MYQVFIVVSVKLFFMNTTRKQPGSTSRGNYFHIEISPKTEFEAFYTKDIGRIGHSLLVLGKRKSDGKWVGQKLLINKNDAYISERGRLESEDPSIMRMLNNLDGDILHKTMDIFYVRKHNNLKNFGKDKQYCSLEECPSMYFENYEDYEKYEEELTKKPMRIQV